MYNSNNSNTYLICSGLVCKRTNDKAENNWHINICHLPNSAFMLAAQLNAFSHFPCAFLRADIHIRYTVTGCAKGFLWCMQHHSATLYVLHKFMNTHEHVLRWLIIHIPAYLPSWSISSEYESLVTGEHSELFFFNMFYYYYHYYFSMRTSLTSSQRAML